MAEKITKNELKVILKRIAKKMDMDDVQNEIEKIADEYNIILIESISYNDELEDELDDELEDELDEKKYKKNKKKSNWDEDEDEDW